jgi:hypothetical protein
MRAIAVIAFGVTLLVAAAFWLIGLYHMIAMAANKTDQAKGKLWLAGFITLYVPSALTPVGRAHRRRALFSFLWFVLSVAAGFVIGFIADLLA